MKDDDFLKEHFKETRTQMRFGSEVEYRLLQYLLLFFPIVGLIFTTLYKSDIDRPIFLFMSITTAIVLIGITILITIKICAEHSKYHDLGLSVQQVWKYFELTTKGAYLENEVILQPEKVLPDEKGKGGFGTGTGYKKTLSIIWAICIVFVGLIITLATLKPSNVSESPPINSSINASITYQI
jgi:hypothetical protein